MSESKKDQAQLDAEKLLSGFTHTNNMITAVAAKLREREHQWNECQSDLCNEIRGLRDKLARADELINDLQALRSKGA